MTYACLRFRELVYGYENVLFGCKADGKAIVYIRMMCGKTTYYANIVVL